MQIIKEDKERGRERERVAFQWCCVCLAIVCLVVFFFVAPPPHISLSFPENGEVQPVFRNTVAPGGRLHSCVSPNYQQKGTQAQTTNLAHKHRQFKQGY